MGHLERALSNASAESGAVLVIFAVFMAVAIGFTSFVLDVGGWFEHQRHLQLQADAAAFAGASQMEFPCTTSVAENIYKAAAQYGGAASVTTPSGTFATEAALHNTQVDEEAERRQEFVHAVINKKSFFGQSKTDNTVEKSPCESNEIDVKMTETHLPFIFAFFGLEPEATAQARIKIVKEQYATNVEPVIESEPLEVRVFYVNDSPDGDDANYSQETLATGLLENAGTNEEKGTIKWTDAKAPVAVKIADPHIGVRIALAGEEGALKGAGNETDAVCTHVYVECFDEDSGVIPPLLNISGYSEEGGGKSEPFTPVAHEVTLGVPTEAEAKEKPCTDGYFSSSLSTEKTATCAMDVTALVTYGSTKTTGVTVTPELVYTEGFTNKKEAVLGTPLTFQGGTWKGNEKLHNWYYGNFGSTEVDLVVKCKPEAGAPCEKATKEESVTLKDVQRVYSSGPDGSNRIISAKVFEPSVSEADANAFEVCEAHNEESCTHNLAVTIELKGSLENAKKLLNKEGQEIPPFHIVFGDNDQEDDDQFVVTCPPTTSTTEVIAHFEAALTHGCEGTYGVNTHNGNCTEEKTAKEKVEKEEEKEKKQRETEEKEREKWLAEEKETKITKAQRTEKETTQKNTRTADEATEAKERTTWKEEQEHKKLPFITEAERKAKEKTQETARLAREAKEAEERAKWAKEETESKLTRAEREAKEAAQKTAEIKRQEEERATKEAREKLGNASRECVGLVSVAGLLHEKGSPKEEVELSALFQNYFSKRVERPVNGFKYECPNAWAKQLVKAEAKKSKTIPLPPILATDSRVLQFFVVPFTVTDFERKNEISPLVPIEEFATFYVTGWGRGNTEAGQLTDTNPAFNPKERRDECSEKLFKGLPSTEAEAEAKEAAQKEVEEHGKASKEYLENEAIPLEQREAEEKKLGFDDNVEAPREIVGHLIKYVRVLGEKPGTVPCKPEELETCEAVLVE